MCCSMHAAASTPRPLGRLLSMHSACQWQYHWLQCGRIMHACKALCRKARGLLARGGYPWQACNLLQGIVPEGEWDAFMGALRAPLPTTFRINGSGRFAADLRDRLAEGYFAQLSGGIEVQHEPPPRAALFNQQRRLGMPCSYSAMHDAGCMFWGWAAVCSPGRMTG